MLQLVVFGLFAFVLGGARAQNLPANAIFQQGLEPVTLERALDGVKAGDIVVIGEIHGSHVIAAQHMQLLEILRQKGHAVSVGLEFFPYPNQPEVDAWRAGTLPEKEFLEKINWGQGFPFSAYRDQALFPRLNQEYLLAINAPRTLTGRIAKVGVEGLSDEEKALLPPQFTLGNDNYFRRFRELMGGPHVPSPEAMSRYFAAQSAWDDTMAWKATEFLKAHPQQVLVIIVGEFHVQYGGGLPDRLKARGGKVHTFSQVNLEGLSDVEQRKEVEPSLQDGPRADFVWTSRYGPDKGSASVP